MSGFNILNINVFKNIFSWVSGSCQYVLSLVKLKYVSMENKNRSVKEISTGRIISGSINELAVKTGLSERTISRWFAKNPTTNPLWEVIVEAVSIKNEGDSVSIPDVTMTSLNVPMSVSEETKVDPKDLKRVVSERVTFTSDTIDVNMISHPWDTAEGVKPREVGTETPVPVVDSIEDILPEKVKAVKIPDDVNRPVMGKVVKPHNERIHLDSGPCYKCGEVVYCTERIGGEIKFSCSGRCQVIPHKVVQIKKVVPVD